MKKTQVVILSVLVGLMVLSCLTGCGGSPASTTAGQSLEPGAMVTLEGTSASVVCSTSKENHQQLGKLARAKDKKGMESMLDLGRIFLVDSGTKAIVLQTTLVDGIEIRIQEGLYEGKECWTERSFLVRVP